ncbi:MAG: YcxB family protein, partial [Ethanoligenens sp.]
YLAGVIIGGVVVFAIIFYLLQEYLPDTWPIIIGMTVVFTVALHFLYKLLNAISVKALVKKLGKEFFDSVQTVSLLDDGVLEHCDLQEAKTPYSKIKKVEETSEYLTIKANIPLLFIPIKNILNPEDKSDFITELKSRMH